MKPSHSERWIDYAVPTHLIQVTVLGPSCSPIYKMYTRCLWISPLNGHKEITWRPANHGTQHKAVHSHTAWPRSTSRRLKVNPSPVYHRGLARCVDTTFYDSYRNALTARKWLCDCVIVKRNRPLPQASLCSLAWFSNLGFIKSSWPLRANVLDPHGCSASHAAEYSTGNEFELIWRWTENCLIYCFFFRSSIKP